MTIQPENETDAYYMGKAVQWTIDREQRFNDHFCPKCKGTFLFTINGIGECCNRACQHKWKRAGMPKQKIPAANGEVKSKTQ